MPIVELVEYPVLNLLRDGGEYFFGLLNTSDKDLGWELPTITFKGQPIELIETIGEGASSIVFSGKLRNSDGLKLDDPDGKVCIKYFRQHKYNYLACEQENLKIVNKLAEQGKVTKVIGIGESDDAKCLIITPVGEHFACTSEQITEATTKLLGSSKSELALSTAADFCALIDIIAEVHKCKLIHRDIKHTNFFKHKYSNDVSKLPSIFHQSFFCNCNNTHLFILVGVFERFWFSCS